MKTKNVTEKNMKVCLVGSSGGHLTHLYMLKPFWKDKNRFWVTFDKEDVNDHQVEFARNVAQRMGTIIEVEDIENLGEIITNYDQIVASMGHGMSSNNAGFCAQFEKIVDGILR